MNADFQRGVSAGMHGVQEQSLADVLDAAAYQLRVANGSKAKAWDALIADVTTTHRIAAEHMKRRFTGADRKAVKDAHEGESA